MPVLLVTIVALVCAALPQPGLAQAPDTTTAVPAPVSYWGAIPPPADSTTAAFENRDRKAWEWALIVPYSVINLPIRWIRNGIGAGVIWADRADLFKYVSIAQVPKGVVPSGGYNSEQGLRLGLNGYLYIADPSNPVRLRAEYSTNEWERYTAGLMINRGGKWEFELGGGYRLRPNLRYYGIGPETDASGVSYYKDERAWGGVLARRHLGRKLFASLGASYSSIDTRLPEEEWSPALPEVYPEVVLAPGFDQRSDGWMTRVALVYNTTRNAGNPDGGTLAGGTVGIFHSTNQLDVEFMAYRFEFQKFMPLWHNRRVLAMRTYFNLLDNTGDLAIPFQRLFINELPDQFRAFNTGRWRDRGITGITLEYRFPFMANRRDSGFGMDTVLFTDIGQVFGALDHISTATLTHSYGFGWRMHLNPHFLGRVEFVWGEEGFQFRLSAKQLFQFSRQVLYNGHEETLIH